MVRRVVLGHAVRLSSCPAARRIAPHTATLQQARDLRTTLNDAAGYTGANDQMVGRT